MRLPPKPPRISLEEKFSTFLHFGQGFLVACWRRDLELTRSLDRMVLLSIKDKIDDELTLTRYFLQRVLQNNICGRSASRLAGRHLSAYLQDSCYWAAKKTCQKLASLPHKFTEIDCFQLANLYLYEPPNNKDKDKTILPLQQLLKRFDLKQSHALKSYVKIRLQGKLEDVIFRSLQIRKCTPWGRLRRMSKKRLIYALQQQRKLSQEDLKSYILAWECFKANSGATVNDGFRRLLEPTPEQFQEMANRYNHLSHSKLNSQSFVNWKTIKAILEVCLEAAKTESRPINTISIEANEEWDINHHITEQISDDFNGLEQEQQEQIIKTVLASAFNLLSREKRSLLNLHHGLKLHYTDIAVGIMGERKKWYQIRRDCHRCYRSLLKDFVEMYFDAFQTERQTNLTDDTLDSMKVLLEEWLDKYCQTDLRLLLKSALHHDLNLEERQQLRRCFQQQLEQQTETERNSPLREIKQRLHSSVKQYVETNWGISLSPIEGKANSFDWVMAVEKKIDSFVEEWLEDTLLESISLEQQ